MIPNPINPKPQAQTTQRSPSLPTRKMRRQRSSETTPRPQATKAASSPFASILTSRHWDPNLWLLQNLVGRPSPQVTMSGNQNKVAKGRIPPRLIQNPPKRTQNQTLKKRRRVKIQMAAQKHPKISKKPMNRPSKITRNRCKITNRQKSSIRRISSCMRPKKMATIVVPS